MSDINDGGPAFPQSENVWNDDTHQYELGMSLAGMSLRDYFAIRLAAEFKWGVGVDDQCAEAAYKAADAMLEARKK